MDIEISDWKRRLVTVRDLAAGWGFLPLNDGSDKPMVGPYRETLKETPFGEFVADFAHLFEDISGDVAQAIANTVAEVRSLLGSNTLTGREFVAHMKSVEAAANISLGALDCVIPDAATVEELVNQLERDYLLALAVTLTSHSAVSSQVHSWLSAGRGVSYLDVLTFRLVDSPGPGRMDMYYLESAIPGGVTTYVHGEGIVDIGPYPEVQSMVYGQWFTHIYAIWEERYRGKIALAHGRASDGECWRRTDFLIPLFGDIRTIRNDFVHNQGVANESVRNPILAWGVQDQPIEISAAQMGSLIGLFPRAELLATPTRAGNGNPISFPWSVSPELVEDIRTRAGVLKRTRKSRRDIGDEALRLWLDANPEPT